MITGKLIASKRLKKTNDDNYFVMFRKKIFSF